MSTTTEYPICKICNKSIPNSACWVDDGTLGGLLVHDACILNLIGERKDLISFENHEAVCEKMARQATKDLQEKYDLLKLFYDRLLEERDYERRRALRAEEEVKVLREPKKFMFK